MGRLRLTCKRAAPRRKRGPGGPLHGAHFSVSTGRFQGYGRQRVVVFYSRRPRVCTRADAVWRDGFTSRLAARRLAERALAPLIEQLNLMPCSVLPDAPQKATHGSWACQNGDQRACSAASERMDADLLGL